MYVSETKDNYSIIKNTKVRAEIESNTNSELDKILNEVIDNGEEKILVDFKNIVYIDSSGLGILLEAMKKLKQQNRKLGILSISRDILEIFIATKIGQYFRFYKLQSKN